MLKIIVALALLVAFYLPAAAAFAGDESGADQDHGTFVSSEIQTEPINLGTVAGSDKVPSGPYFEQRLDNMGQ